jgi:CelD/BcsL family acetyltransferase involved in cellulose biosynthesis
VVRSSWGTGDAVTHSDGPSPARSLVVNCLGTWAAAWDELVTQAHVPTPFLRSWWLGAVAGKNSVFVLFLDGDTLIGGLALERRSRVLGVPIYQFSGSGDLCPDHLDVLAARGKESTVSRAVAEWLRRPGSRVLDLDGLVETSLLEATFGSATTTVIDVAPWDELPATDAEYFASRSANLRKTLGRAQRRLLAAGITHRRITNGKLDDAAVALREFVLLQQDRGGRGALLKEVPRLTAALVAGLAAGEVRIDVLESVDRVVLVEISFQIEGAVRVYQSARALDHNLRDASGVVLLEIVRQACAEGCRELDLLRGAEPYKARFVHHARRVKRLRVAHGARGAIVLTALKVVTSSRGVAGAARRLLRTQRGAGFVGRRRRRAAE